MNFYKRFKAQLLDDRNNRGYMGKVALDFDVCRLLIEDYERLNELVRRDRTHPDTFDHFESVIKAAYFDNKKDYGKLFLRIGNILKPLIDEDEKMKVIEKVRARNE